MLCLIDTKMSEKSKFIKIFNVEESLAISLVHKIYELDLVLIENLFASEVFFNNTIVSNNSCFSLVTSYAEPKIFTH